MTSMNKIVVLALLYLLSGPTWARQVDFCKVIRTFDDKDLSASAVINYENCSGVAFFDYAKNFVKASCWSGAIDLLEGKCAPNKDQAIEHNNADSNPEAEFETERTD